jgi:hypothetical protein
MAYLADAIWQASATVRGGDFKHLANLRDRLGAERFHRGVVLHPGEERLSFGSGWRPGRCLRCGVRCLGKGHPATVDTVAAEPPFSV